VKVTREKVENSQAFLTVEMEPGEMAEPLEAAYKRIAQKANIPGFRKGKAPRMVLERHMGKERVLEEAIEHLVPQAYEQALKEQEIKPFAQPSIEVTQADPLIFKAIVPLTPTTTLGDYRSIRVEPEAVEKTEDKIDQVLEEIRHQHATWEPVERPVDFGDLVVINIGSQIEEKPFLNKLGLQYQVLKDSIAPAPGFAGEEKEFKLTFPADYPRKEIGGKEASFKVKVEEIKEEKLPPLDDELAPKVSTDFKTLEKLREEVGKSLKERAEERARMEYEEKVVNSVIDQAQVEFPPVLVDMEINHIINDQARQLQMSGRSLEEYLNSVKKTPEELREELRPTANRNVIGTLVLGEVASQEKIEAAEAEIDKEIDGMTKGAAEDKKEELRKLLDTPQTRESIKRSLVTRKTIERLSTIAKGAETGQPEEKEEKK
jgi:trigger factor